MAATLSQGLLLTVPLAPLAGALIAGLAGRWVGRRGAHFFTILGVAIAFVCSLLVLRDVAAGARFNETIYQWAVLGNLVMEVGFLVDGLTAMMMVVVTFVSLMVHVYTIGYMDGDPGYQRFFAYISLFTFSMLMLVMSNNFLQLFFGWEAVGLVSYLLIGFWYTRPTAIFANLKAFLVNRVGDFGFLLGIAAVLTYFNSLDYWDVFAAAPAMADMTMQVFPGVDWSLMSVICILLFIGAVGYMAAQELQSQAVEAEADAVLEGEITVTPTVELGVFPPTPSPSPTVDASIPTATPTPILCRAVVEGTSGNGLMLRETPGGAEITILAEATLVTLVQGEGPQQANGIAWRLVRDNISGEEGWVAEDFLSLGPGCE